MIPKGKTISIYTQLANKYNIPYQVVEVICNHPFKFASRIISDDVDIKPIMFGYLFKLKLKNRFKGNKNLKYEKGNKLISESTSEVNEH